MNGSGRCGGSFGQGLQLSLLLMTAPARARAVGHHAVTAGCWNQAGSIGDPYQRPPPFNSCQQPLTDASSC
jgi:hypothetical protein